MNMKKMVKESLNENDTQLPYNEQPHVKGLKKAIKRFLMKQVRDEWRGAPADERAVPDFTDAFEEVSDIFEEISNEIIEAAEEKLQTMYGY